MRTSLLKLYAPFVAIAAVQGLVIAVAPSNPPDQQVAAFGGQSADPGQVAGEVAAAPGAGTGAASSSGGTGSGGAGGGTSQGTTATTAPGTGGGGGGGGAVVPTNDTSHCAGEEHFDLLWSNPPCMPLWPEGADNGGATYRGVTADSIKIVFFQEEANPQVQQILAAQGLAATDEERAALYEAAEEFINANYVTYGRTIEIVQVKGACPQTPPDVDACMQAAEQVIGMDPYLVLWSTPLYAEVFDVWARAGIPSIGGWHFENSYFTGRRPYRYDVFMDGTRSADMVAEYYCKKMANQNASHSGRVIHSEVGLRDQVPRRLGIVVPEIPANKATADHLKSQVAACDNGPDPLISTYESNIERATEQTEATVSAFVDGDVTTVVCLCDPIAPAFLTKGMTSASYFPEFLLPGTGLLDFDKLGRLYDSEQMVHAFGPSHLQVQPRHEDSDASRMWQATGREGVPCQSCNLYWAYMHLAASMIHATGPDLNPVTMEQATLSLPPSGGWATREPERVLAKFGQGDYTALSDAKEVYWSGTAPSTIDGNPGSYIWLNDGRRYELGQWSSTLEIPVPSR